MGLLIKIEELKPGMVIDKDVTNLHGAVLLRKGNPVTEKHIHIFKTWGVKSVFIIGGEDAEELDGRDPQEVAAEKIRETERCLDEKFADVAGNEVMLLIKEVAYAHRVRRIKEKYNSKA